MPKQKRIKTSYPGVYWIEGKQAGAGRKERIYYIYYRKDGKVIEEKAGRQFKDDMTPARANVVRSQKIAGLQPTNRERREAIKAAEEAKRNKWTIDRLWLEYKAQKPDSKVMRVDAGRYHKYIELAFKDKEPKELVQYEVSRLKVNLLKKKSPQTVKHVLALLKRIINFGVNNDLCRGTGFKIEMPRVNNEKTEDLTPKQLTNLMEAINQDENTQAANLMRLALYTGMRRGELFKLKWDDLDFERGFIHIKDPKGGPDQTIPLNDAAKDVLENHSREDSPFVFPGRDGQQRVTISVAVNRIKKRAGLPKDFRPVHGLRHVYASTLASSGQVDLYTLQKLLTHKSPQMTQRYAHLRDEALRRAANLAASLIHEAVTNKDSSKLIELDKSE